MTDLNKTEEIIIPVDEKEVKSEDLKDDAKYKEKKEKPKKQKNHKVAEGRTISCSSKRLNSGELVSESDMGKKPFSRMLERGYIVSA